AKTPITIRHLLTHSSGIGSGLTGELIETKHPMCKWKTLEEAVASYPSNPLEFEPFTGTAYSATHAFDIVARIAELISGMPYDQFLEKNLFQPLGIVDMTFSPTAEQWSRVIPMHAYEDGVGKVKDFPANSLVGGIPTTYFCAGGGLASTMSDYMKFAAMLLNYGSVNGKQLVSEQLIRDMATPQLPSSVDNGEELWGLAVRVIAKESYRDLPCGAFSWSGAYGTHFWVDPANRITAIYMKNSEYDGGARAVTAKHFEQDVTAALQ
ncbi:MAG: serine hydrolase, partial [Roseburia sp.]|nr:serine hydrolase [Roseburia sp.]